MQTKPEAKEIQKVAIEIMNRAEKEALQRTIEQPFIEKKWHALHILFIIAYVKILDQGFYIYFPKMKNFHELQTEKIIKIMGKVTFFTKIPHSSFSNSGLSTACALL